ncbi:MAG TPA: hypothetical protein VFD43_08545, partial [Planctomycetota bacterium]|nr:hypothetical protein [Planctomycetota bacterium]
LLALPLAILAVLFFGPSERKPLARILPLLLVFLLLLGGWIALREAAVGDPRYPVPVEDNPLVARTGVDRIVSALAVGVRWIVQLLVPIASSVDYGAPVPIAGSVPVGIAAFLSVLALGALVAASVLLRRTRPAIAFWCAFLLCTYLPTSNLLFSTGTVFAERLLYLPSVGVCALLGGTVALDPETSRHFQCSSVVRPGQSVSLAFGGQPGETVLLFVSGDAGYLHLPKFGAPYLLGSIGGDARFILGALDPTGALQITAPWDGTGLPVEALALHLQPAFLGSSEGPTLGPAALLVLLQPGV